MSNLERRVDKLEQAPGWQEPPVFLWVERMEGGGILYQGAPFEDEAALLRALGIDESRRLLLVVGWQSGEMHNLAGGKDEPCKAR
jgi:hypothetical protein